MVFFFLGKGARRGEDGDGVGNFCDADDDDCDGSLDPDELDLPHEEALLFEDMEDGRQTPTHPDATRERYVGEMESFREALADNLGVVGVEFDSLTTHSDLGLALRKFLHHRRLGF